MTTDDSDNAPDLTRYVERVRVLHGHTSPDSAYLVEDYPYGRVLRCKIRYWIDTAANGKQRFVSQTTNPKRDTEHWNNPKRDIYYLMIFMFLNGDGHVKSSGVSESGVSPEGHARMHLSGKYAQLTDEQRARYDALTEISRRYAPPWQEWDRKVAALAEHIRITGEDPTITGDTWDAPPGLRYLGAHDAPAYLASARQLLAG